MNTTMSSRKLTLDDIADLRAYERERETFRARVIAMRKLRRVTLGPVITVSFENRETMRYQIQEMVRVEKTMTDEGVQEELNAYNPMVPEPGQLCATVFVELTTDAQVREWLPKLAGLENAVSIRLSDGSVVTGRVDAAHAAGLTREDVTAAVHYLVFDFTAPQIELFRSGSATLQCTLGAYPEATEIPAAVRGELLADLLP